MTVSEEGGGAPRVASEGAQDERARVQKGER